MATAAYNAGVHVQIPFSKLIVDRMDYPFLKTL